MSREVGRRQVSIGPDLRKAKTPILLTAGLALLIIDSFRWHLVHHLLGPASGWFVVIVAIIWVAWIIRRRRRS